MDQQTLLKSLTDAMKNPSEDIARRILADAGVGGGDELAKSISTATGLVAFDLQAPAKNLYPVYTPIRNKLPRVGGGKGTATNWRQVNNIIGSGYDNTAWVPEGVRSGTMSYNTSNKSASYVTIGEEDYATFEAISAGRTFEDIQANMTMRMLQKMMMKEEMALLFGNNSNSLGAPSAPTLSVGGTGATLPSATYSVIVVALTGEGFYNSSVANGVATQKTITSADGSTFTLNGGSSNKSTNATQAVTLGQVLSATVTPIQGAVGYAWFVGTAGNEVLQAITTINSLAISAPLASGTQAATAVTGDNSTNSLAFDGLFSTAAKAGSGAQVAMQATGTPGTGTPLTASGSGTVNEIDNLLKAMWDNYQVSVSQIYVNSQELKNISHKVLSSPAGGSLLTYFKTADRAEYALTAGGTIEFYYNPFQAPGAGKRIPIDIHPKVPPGTIVAWAADLPIQYQNNEVPNVAEVRTREDYYQIQWPLKTRRREVGVYAEEALVVYAPFAMGLLTNIGNG